MKHFNFIVLPILICAFFSACASKPGDTPAAQENYSHASWSSKYSEIQSLTNDSELIVTATYVGCETELRDGLVFTWEQWRISNVLFGDLAAEDIINIRKTGGTHDGITTFELEEIPLTESDDTREYIFFLEGNTENLDYYTIVGGYTGCGITGNGSCETAFSSSTDNSSENTGTISPVWSGNTIFDGINIENLESYIEVRHEKDSD